MRILIITPYYSPDLGPSAPLFKMLSTCLVARGHQMTVIVAVPHYPSGQIPKEYKKWKIQRSYEDGVEVIRVPLPSLDRAKMTNRMIQFICYQIGATWEGLNRNYDAVIATTTALSVWLPYACLAVLRRIPSIYSVHDLYPDIGVSLGIFKNKVVIKAVASLEGYCLRHAQQVRILSDSFRPGLHQLGVPDSKMVLIYDWVDTDLIHPIPQENPFSKGNGFSNHFIVLYAGNIGLSQGLEIILVAAEMLADQPDIKFIFVGDGSGKESLQSQANLRHLHNVKFIPFQPREILCEVLASADISLVILRRGVGSNSLPSKTFSIMASGRPILVSVDEYSETRKLVKQADAGVWVPPEDPLKLVQAILALKQDKSLRDRLGHNGRIWVEQHHSPQNAAEQFEKLLQTAIQIHTSSSL